MIKTLRITSVLVVILAGVLIKFLVLPMVSNVSGDPQVEKILDSKGVIEHFKETKGAHAKPTGNQTSPLVLQATAYSRYLDPPAKAKPRVPGSLRKPTGGIAIGPTTPKFKVFATTYFEGNPELSQALIDEPGKGRYWVRQSSMVGHLLIEQVRDGVVIVKSSKETFELEIEKAPVAGLTKGKSSASKGTSGKSSGNRTLTTSGKTLNSPTRTSSVRTTTSKAPSRTSRQRNSAISDEKAKELFSKLEDLQRSHRLEKTASGVDGEEMAARIGKLLDTFKSPADNTADAKGDGQTPNKTLPMPKTSKIQASPTKSDAPTQK